MFVWLAPLRVNFNNVLAAAFVRADPKSAKKTDNFTVFFALSGSACVKVANRTLMKLTQSVYPSTFNHLVLYRVCHGFRQAYVG